jgi:hypothetical protein
VMAHGFVMLTHEVRAIGLPLNRLQKHWTIIFRVCALAEASVLRYTRTSALASKHMDGVVHLMVG